MPYLACVRFVFIWVAVLDIFYCTSNVCFSTIPVGVPGGGVQATFANSGC